MTLSISLPTATFPIKPLQLEDTSKSSNSSSWSNKAFSCVHSVMQIPVNTLKGAVKSVTTGMLPLNIIVGGVSEFVLGIEGCGPYKTIAKDTLFPLVTIAIAAPVWEELMFRGLLQKVVVPKALGRWS